MAGLYVQASAGLFYEVFKKHDAGNLLLTQAETEALEQELEIVRLRTMLERLATWELRVMHPPHATPFSFPLMVERFREEITTEQLAVRIARMLAELEAAAEGAPAPEGPGLEPVVARKKAGRERGYVKRVRM